MKRPRKPLAATLARGLHARDPSLTPTELAKRIDSTRQAVQAALAVKHARTGRPGVESRTVRLSSALLERANAKAAHLGVSTREWLETAIAAWLR